MSDEDTREDQFSKHADATSGGGASADRGGRDSGMPGPAPGSADRENKSRSEAPKRGQHQQDAP